MQRNGYLDRTERAPLLETREELAPARGVWNGILLSSVLWLVAIAAFLVWNEQHDDKRCEAIKQTISSEYDLLIKNLGSEFYILLKAPLESITAATTNENIPRAIENMRTGKVVAQGGYDGIFGKIDVLGGEKIYKPKQSSLL
jgi:hypothetical protein